MSHLSKSARLAEKARKRMYYRERMEIPGFREKEAARALRYYYEIVQIPGMREKIAARTRKRRADNPEAARRIDRKAYLKHRKQKIAAACKYHRDHREARRAYKRNYWRTHRKEINARRRAQVGR